MNRTFSFILLFLALVLVTALALAFRLHGEPTREQPTAPPPEPALTDTRSEPVSTTPAVASPSTAEPAPTETTSSSNDWLTFTDQTLGIEIAFPADRSPPKASSTSYSGLGFDYVLEFLLRSTSTREQTPRVNSFFTITSFSTSSIRRDREYLGVEPDVKLGYALDWLEPSILQQADGTPCDLDLGMMPDCRIVTLEGRRYIRYVTYSIYNPETVSIHYLTITPTDDRWINLELSLDVLLDSAPPFGRYMPGTELFRIIQRHAMYSPIEDYVRREVAALERIVASLTFLHASSRQR